MILTVPRVIEPSGSSFPFENFSATTAFLLRIDEANDSLQIYLVLSNINYVKLCKIEGFLIPRPCGNVPLSTNLMRLM